MVPRLSGGAARRARAEPYALRLSTDRGNDRILRQSRRRAEARARARDRLRAGNRPDVLSGRRGGRAFRRAVRRRVAESDRAIGAGRYDGDAGAFEFWIVFAAAAAMDDETGRHRAARLCGLVADGLRDGRGGGTVHRSYRARAVADGRAERKSAVRLRVILHARGWPRFAIHRAR